MKVHVFKDLQTCVTTAKCLVAVLEAINANQALTGRNMRLILDEQNVSRQNDQRFIIADGVTDGPYLGPENEKDNAYFLALSPEKSS